MKTKFFSLSLGLFLSAFALIASNVKVLTCASYEPKMPSEEVSGKETKALVSLLKQQAEEVAAKQEKRNEDSENLEKIRANAQKRLDLLQEAVRNDFTAEHDFTAFYQPIPLEVIQDTVKEYLALCEKETKRNGAQLAVGKHFIGTQKTLVVGDLHGAIGALYILFDDWKARNFMGADYRLAPGVRVQFLGDYVDRGQGGIEVLFVLACLKLINPDSVILGRGNHENRIQNESFTEELKRKYGKKLWEVYFDEITKMYETFPITTVLAAGKRCDQEHSYALLYHGMLDKALAISLDEICAAKFSSEEAKSIYFFNTKGKIKKTYASKRVMWGDICQADDDSQMGFEKAVRRMTFDEKGEETGRILSNQTWREEQLESLLKKGHQIKVEVRGHQHQTSCGVMINSATIGAMLFTMTMEELDKRFDNLRGPYNSKGPYPVEGAKEFLKGMYKSWADGLGEVPQFTLSAAYRVQDIGTVKELSYLVLTPGANPQVPWGITKISVVHQNEQGEDDWISSVFDIREQPRSLKTLFATSSAPDEQRSTSASSVAQAPVESSSTSLSSTSASAL